MKDEIVISDKKLAKLAKRLSKTFTINEEEAMEVIYEEWDLVESLHVHLIDEINYTYRIA
jgi:hypothetical protein